MRILITGGLGRLATELHRHFCRDHQVVAPSRRDLDICSSAQVAEYIAQTRPDAIFNCAAFNEVDRAEDARKQAFAVNANACFRLAEYADAVGALLVHFSSDFVFDGLADRPYVETDAPHPLGVYGASKLAGEELARCATRHYVLRLASVFGPAPSNPPRRATTIDRMLDALGTRAEVRAFRDRTVTPSYTPHVARALERILRDSPPHGVYHCTTSDCCTWLELANYLANVTNADAKITPVSTRDVPMRAPRPRYCALSSARLQAIGIPVPSWREVVAEYVAFRKGPAVA